MDRIDVRSLAGLYCGLFVAVTALGYIPAFQDETGSLFGLFSLQLHDDALHMGSALWAGVAAWHSAGAARAYFRIFGPLYFLDGVLGLLTGSGYLDAGILRNGVLDLPLMTRVFTNIPHLTLGGFAVIVGYVLYARATSGTSAAGAR
jgi:hypothetical protein